MTSLTDHAEELFDHAYKALENFGPSNDGWVNENLKVNAVVFSLKGLAIEVAALREAIVSRR